MNLSEEILKDLRNKGYSGDELQEKYKLIQSKIPQALEAMMADETIRVEGDLDDYLDGLPDDDE